MALAEPPTKSRGTLVAGRTVSAGQLLSLLPLSLSLLKNEAVLWQVLNARAPFVDCTLRSRALC